MKCITIKQPWATLIAKGYKKYEFRTWKTKYRGDILIHAGKTIDKDALEYFKYLNLEYPTGCIIAKAKITDCLLVDKTFLNKLPNSPIYDHLKQEQKKTLYGFKLDNIEEIKSIYIKGKLSLWEYEKEK